MSPPARPTDDDASTGDGGTVDGGGTERVGYDGGGDDRANDVDVGGAGTRRPETTRGWEQCVGITSGSVESGGGGGDDGGGEISRDSPRRRERMRMRMKTGSRRSERCWRGCARC
jgi:hypothetical protein